MQWEKENSCPCCSMLQSHPLDLATWYSVLWRQMAWSDGLGPLLGILTVPSSKLCTCIYAHLFRKAGCLFQTFGFWRHGVSVQERVPIKLCLIIKWFEICKLCMVCSWSLLWNHSISVPVKKVTGVKWQTTVLVESKYRINGPLPSKEGKTIQKSLCLVESMSNGKQNNHILQYWEVPLNKI